MIYCSPEDQLLTAIESDDLTGVCQLISSGIDVNTVLHCKVRREGATVLATAAYEGKTAIMEYLLQQKATVNAVDPCNSRNALHWACLGGHIETVKLLLAHKIDINCVDRDNVTPLIKAAMSGSCDIVAVLINHGAYVNQFDRLHSSALHYASFHGKKEIVSLVIKAGCIANNPVIFGQGSPLANLVYQQDVDNVKLLIEAGYSLSQDTWIERFKSQDSQNQVATLLQLEYHNPPPLLRLCRTVIRKHLKGIRVEAKIKKLPLPSRVLAYVALDDL